MDDALDRILAPGYLDALSTRSTDDVRAMRGECQAVEDAVSYLRRLAQGRLDIVTAELRRRSEGGRPDDLSALVAALPETLAEARPAGANARPLRLTPVDEAGLTASLDAVVDSGSLTALPERSDGELDELRLRLEDFERSLSERRRSLHQRLDALAAELTRRYRTGEASVESLLS